MTLILTLIGLLVVIIATVYWYYNRDKAKKIVAGVAVVVAGAVTQLETELGNDNNTELRTDNNNTELIQAEQGDTHKPIDIEPTTNPSQEVTKPIHIQPTTNPIVAISDLKRAQVIDNGDEYMKTTFTWKGKAKYIQIKSLDEPWEDKKRETKGNSHTYALNANERFKITLFDARGNTISTESNYISSLEVSYIEYRRKGWHKTLMTWKGTGFTHINYKFQKNEYITDKEAVTGNSHILWLPHYEDVIVTVYNRNGKKESIKFVVSPTGKSKRYTDEIIYDKNYKTGIAKYIQVELISDMGVIHTTTDKNGFFTVNKHPDRNYKVVAIENGHRFEQEGDTQNLVWHPEK